MWLVYLLGLGAVLALLGIAVYFSSAQRTAKHLRRLVELAEEEKVDRAAMLAALRSLADGRRVDRVTMPARKAGPDPAFDSLIAEELKR